MSVSMRVFTVNKKDGMVRPVIGETEHATYFYFPHFKDHPSLSGIEVTFKRIESTMPMYKYIEHDVPDAIFAKFCAMQLNPKEQ